MSHSARPSSNVSASSIPPAILLASITNPPKPLHRLARRLRLRTVLVVPFIVPIVLSTSLVGWLSFRNGQQAVNMLATQLQTEVSGRVKQYLDSYLTAPNQLNRINLAAQEVGILNLKDRQKLEKYFWRQMQVFPVGYLNYGSVDGYFTGIERLNTGQLRINEVTPQQPDKLKVYDVKPNGDRDRQVETIDYDFPTDPWYSASIKAGKPIWSPIYQWKDQPEVMSVSSSYPVRDSNKRMIGVIGVDLIISQINTFLEQLKIGHSGKSFILERDGMLVANSSTAKVFQTQNGTVRRIAGWQSTDPVIQKTSAWLKQKFGDLRQIQTSQQLSVWIDGHQFLVNVKPWKDELGLDWLVVIVVPESDFMAQIHENSRSTILLCLLTFAGATAIGLLTSRWIGQQILKLDRAAKAIAHGNLDDRVQVQGIVELENLATSFNGMSDQIKQSFEALQHSEATNRAIVAAIPDLLIRATADGTYLDIVGRDRFLVHDAENFQSGMTVFNSLPPTLAALRMHSIHQALATGEMQLYDQHLQIDGEWRDEEVRIAVTGSDEVLIIVRDITDRKRAEASLRESEVRNRAFLDAIPDLILRLNGEGIYLDVVEAKGTEIIVNKQSRLGKSIYDILSKDLADQYMVRIQKALKTGETQTLEYELEQENKSKYFESRIVQSGNDEVIFIVRDITNRKRSEAALRKSEANNRALINALPDLLIRINKDGDYLEVINGDRFNALRSDAGIVSLNVYAILPLEVAEQQIRYIRQALQTGELQIFEQQLEINEQVQYEEVRIMAIGEDEALLMIRDITARKHAEDELKRLTESFARFFPPEYLKFLNKESVTHIQLGDHISKEMAVMFSDIRSFTTLSESMTPKESFDFLNAYLRQVAPGIRAHDGVIVKFLGDGVMAVFPNSVDDAVEAGIDKFNRVQEYNCQRQAEGFLPIAIGMGIHVGHMMVGIVGEHNRIQGDALSDNVNLTARLEGLTKFYGVSLVISEDVLNRLTYPENYLVRFLDRVIVKGRTEAVGIYEILDACDVSTRQLKLQTLPDFGKGLKHYCSGNLVDAQTSFERVLNINSLDKTAKLYLDRVQQLTREGIPADWNGIWAFTQK